MNRRQRSPGGLGSAVGRVGGLLLIALWCGPVGLRAPSAGATPYEDAVAAYLDQIAEQVARQSGYQELIREKRRRVFLQLIVKTGGELDYVTVDHSSGSAVFDAMALALVRQAQPFGELPRVLADRGWFAFILSVPIP